MMWKTGKILAVSSPGGHWVQLNKICNMLEEKHPVVYASPRSQYQLKKQGERTVHNILDVSADNKPMLIPLAFQMLYLFIKERPQTIISTGAAPGVVAILLGKYLGIKTIWIDSIANVQQLSRSGRMIKAHADVVITQWEPLSDGKTILHKGSVL
ncbi:MAG: oligosaccharide biosynthesis protein Alg14 [Thiotrichaceae bacterium]